MVQESQTESQVWIVSVTFIPLGQWYYAHKTQEGADKRMQELRDAGNTGIGVMKLDLDQ